MSNSEFGMRNAETARKSLKDYTDPELHELFQQALDEAREPDCPYAEIKLTVSGGKPKFLTIEKPIV